MKKNISSKKMLNSTGPDIELGGAPVLILSLTKRFIHSYSLLSVC